eukprot:NODE_700_length_5043_cov_0.336367.p3 type:complete len:210 gc:universal NODE_700_length_5043_cov_0.336367:1290-661(-)
MDQLQSPLQPRTESPVLTYTTDECDMEFKLPQPLLDNTYSNRQWEYSNPVYDKPMINKSTTSEKKKRDPYSLVISKLVYMFLEHMNSQVETGICSCEDLNILFTQRNVMIPLMTRQYCTFKNFQIALEHVQNYADLEHLLDEIGMNQLVSMKLNSLFFSYLRDNQVILRKFYTHVDLSRKKDQSQISDLQELGHISKAWSGISKKKKYK